MCQDRTTFCPRFEPLKGHAGFVDVLLFLKPKRSQCSTSRRKAPRPGLMGTIRLAAIGRPASSAPRLRGCQGRKQLSAVASRSVRRGAGRVSKEFRRRASLSKADSLNGPRLSDAWAFEGALPTRAPPRNSAFRRRGRSFPKAARTRRSRASPAFFLLVRNGHLDPLYAPVLQRLSFPEFCFTQYSSLQKKGLFASSQSWLCYCREESTA